MFRLITGEEIADEGEIIGVTSVNECTSSFVSSIGIISQHPFLFNDTVCYNLTLGQELEEELFFVLKQSQNLDFELTDGLDFIIK